MFSPHAALKGRSSAFTLIELLAVVAIAGILAALTFGALGRVTETGKETKCLSNLKQIGTALFAYSSDNGGMLPPVRLQINADLTWQQVLVRDRYVDQKVMFCPAARQANRGWLGTHPDYAASTRTTAANGLLNARVGLMRDANSPRRLAEIAKPASALLVADAHALSSSVFQGTWSMDLRYFALPTAASSPSGMAPRHGATTGNLFTGKFGALYADGHVEMIPWKDPRLADTTFLRSFLYAE